MTKRNKTILAWAILLLVIASIIAFVGNGERPIADAYNAGFDQGYNDVMREPLQRGWNSKFVSDVIREHETGVTLGRLSPRDDDPRYLSGYKAGMRAAAEELDSR